MARPYFDKGAYVGEIVRQGLSETSNGNSQFWLACTILGKPDPNNSGGYFRLEGEEQERTVYRVITDKTIDFALEDLTQLGFTGTSFGQLDPSHPQHQSFVGVSVDLYCKIETYEGQPQEKWQLSRPMAKPLEVQKVRELDAIFGSRLKQAARAATPKAQAPKATNGRVPAMATAGGFEPGITDDDVPF